MIALIFYIALSLVSCVTQNTRTDGQMEVAKTVKAQDHTLFEPTEEISKCDPQVDKDACKATKSWKSNDLKVPPRDTQQQPGSSSAIMLEDKQPQQQHWGSDNTNTPLQGSD